VVNKQLTVAGKPINEFIEVINCAEGWEHIKTLAGAKTRAQLTKSDLLDLHRILQDKIDRTNAGKFRNVSLNLPHLPNLPDPTKIESTIDQFFGWLAGATDHPVQVAFVAQAKMVAIHPFLDANGRVARLFTNLLLMQAGYPPALISTNQKDGYFKGLRDAAAGRSDSFYLEVMGTALNHSLDEAIKLVAAPVADVKPTGKLLKIGQMAKTLEVTVPTIRFWSKEGILPIVDFSKGGYQLYDESSLERAREILRLQNEEKLSIKDLKAKFGE